MTIFVPIKEVLNPEILNDGMVGFQGDSEYVDENGELHFGSWSFIGFADSPTNEELAKNGEKWRNWTVKEDGVRPKLYENYLYFGVILPIENDKGEVCKVKFHYTRSD